MFIYLTEIGILRTKLVAKHEERLITWKAHKLVEKLNYLLVTRPNIVFGVMISHSLETIGHNDNRKATLRILGYLANGPKKRYLVLGSKRSSDYRVH